jgi:hypothetical protein
LTWTPHPGQLGYQLGKSLIAIQENVEQEDLAGVRNQVRLMKAKCFPKLTKEQRLDYAKIPVESDEWPEQYELEMQRVEFLLEAMTLVNVYAWTESEIMDARELRLDGV